MLPCEVSLPGGERTMRAVRRICVAVKDLSESALAVDLVKAMNIDGVQVRVVHVCVQENFGRARFSIEQPEEASFIVESALSDFLRAGIAVQGKVCHAAVGKASEAIVDDATAWGAAAIVLGHSHRGKLGFRLRGNVVQRLLRSSPCRVIVAASEAVRGADAPEREQVA